MDPATKEALKNHAGFAVHVAFNHRDLIAKTYIHYQNAYMQGDGLKPLFREMLNAALAVFSGNIEEKSRRERALAAAMFAYFDAAEEEDTDGTLKH